MSKVSEVLTEGEVELGRTRPHWQMLLGPGLVAALGAAGSLALCHAVPVAHGPPARVGWLAALGLEAFTLTPLVYRWAWRRETFYVLTNRRLIASQGLLTRTTVEVWLPRVTGVDVEQTWLGRLGDFGTLHIEGYGGTQAVFRNVEHPQDLRSLVERQLAGSGLGREAAS